AVESAARSGRASEIPETLECFADLVPFRLPCAQGEEDPESARHHAKLMNRLFLTRHREGQIFVEASRSVSEKRKHLVAGGRLRMLCHSSLLVGRPST